MVVTLVVRFAYPPGLYPNLRMADLSALFYFSNWWQIAASGNYFVATGAVSPLTHTWSLAVEEQFYLVWPLVVLAVLHLGRRTSRGIELLLGVSVAGVIASATEMAVLYHPGADTTRLYFGTDTHAQSILVGAALACVLTLIQRRRGLPGMAPTARSSGPRWPSPSSVWPASAGTLVLTNRLTGTDALAYRGGFLLSALSAAAIITRCGVRASAAPSPPCCRCGPWCGWAPSPTAPTCGTTRCSSNWTPDGPAWVACPSWPSGERPPSPWPAASYYLVERPVMEGVFWRSLRAAGPALAAMGATVAVVVAGTTTVATAAARPGTVASTRATLPPAVHDRLESVGAFSGNPVRFLLLGDSLAITLSVGLGTGSVHAYGVQVIDDGVFGCDYDTSPAIAAGQLTIPYNDCLHWRSLYAADIARTHPDVVGLLTGRWSITDREVDGQTVHVGQPAWDDHLVSEYSDIVEFLAGQGVKVVLFTLPYFDPPQEAPDGSTFPENQPARVAAFNRDLRRVAAAGHGAVTLVDLNTWLDPHGRFQTVVGGVVARWPDGIHVTPAGGQWLQPRILPEVAEFGLAARAGVTR